MKKNIKVIIQNRNLYQDPIQRIQQVSRGYAFNYLIPNRIAEIATKGKIKHLQMLQNTVSKKQDTVHNYNLKINNEIELIKVLHIRKKCGQNRQIFGSISEQEIIDKIFQITGYIIEKKQITIKPIKEIGQYICSINIENTLKPNIKVYILPQEIL